MLHGKLLARFHRARLWLRLFALLPKDKHRANLQLLRDHGLERQHSFWICLLVGFHRHGFDLSAGAVADVECGCDLALFSGRHFVLL